MASGQKIGIRRSEVGGRRWRFGGPVFRCFGRAVIRRSGVEAFGFFSEDFPRAVGGSVVDHDDFVRDAAKVQLEVEVLDGGRDAAFLVTGRNDDGEQTQ